MICSRPESKGPKADVVELNLLENHYLSQLHSHKGQIYDRTATDLKVLLTFTSSLALYVQLLLIFLL